MKPECNGLLPIPPFTFSLFDCLFLSVERFEASSEFSLFSAGYTVFLNKFSFPNLQSSQNLEVILFVQTLSLSFLRVELYWSRGYGRRLVNKRSLAHIAVLVIFHIWFFKMGQTWPLFVYFRSFHVTNIVQFRL